MAVKLVLLHSPLVGPGNWSVLAPLLRSRGFAVSVPDLSSAMQGNGPYYPELVRIARAAIGDRRNLILIAHSGAGPLIPAIAEGELAAGAIFMDALLPHPGTSWFSTAPAALKSHLVQMAHDGRVPPWHRWWPKGAIESLFNDTAAYERFAAELRDIPLAYFEETAPDAGLPPQFNSAYLQLSAGYAAEAALAEQDCWPVARLPLHHLAMLTHGEEVAAQVEILANALASGAAD